MFAVQEIHVSKRGPVVFFVVRLNYPLTELITLITVHCCKSHLQYLTRISLAHDDVIKWKHFPRYWPFVMEGNPPVTSGFPSQRPVMRNRDVFFDLRLNKRLCKHSIRRWFETPSRSLWRHCNVEFGDWKSSFRYDRKVMKVFSWQ